MQQNNNKSIHLIREQATIINQTIYNSQANGNLLNKIAVAHNNLVSSFNRMQTSYQNLTDQTFKELVTINTINSNIRILQTLTYEIGNNLNQLETAWSLLKQHRLSPYFIPPQQLFSSLTQIENNLPGDLHLPTPLEKEFIFIYYDISKVTVAIDSDFLHLYIEIPLRAPNRFFHLYRAVPLPVLLPNSSLSISIIPPHPFLAITEDKSAFMELQLEDMTDCSHDYFKACPPPQTYFEPPLIFLLICSFYRPL